MVILLKGLSGSGKSSLVRRLAASYGPILHTARAADGRPLGLVRKHPVFGRPLLIVGCYERQGGGCDAVRAIDGGLAYVEAAALSGHAEGWDVVAEGNQLSFDSRHTGRVIARAPTRILVLSPDLAACRLALARRRGLSSRQATELDERLAAEAAGLRTALDRLPPHAPHATVSFQEAGTLLARWLDLDGKAFPGDATAHRKPVCRGA